MHKMCRQPNGSDCKTPALEPDRTRLVDKRSSLLTYAVTSSLGPVIRRFTTALHRVRPTWSRAVPDFSSDLIHPGEHKLAVPGYAQLDGYSCGATAGWAVLKTFHPKASFRSFYKA